MGGMNSGRRSGRGTVEGCASIVLSINTIIRATGGRSPSGRRLTVTVNGQPQTILVRLDLEPAAETGSLTLKYDVQHTSAATGPQHYAVRLVSTPCPFGGRRWWAICPATGRRAVKLYLPNGGRRFLSRAAYGMPYQSQRETEAGRAWRAIREVDRRLGMAPAGIGAALEKPKWMRWRTFNRLCDRRHAAEEAIDADMLRTMDRFARHLPG